MPLSLDLRKRVMEAVDAGEHTAVIASRFKVCQKTIYNWINLRNETEKLEPKPYNNPGHGHKILNWDAFRNFAQISQHLTLEEMVKAWKTQHHIVMSLPTMWRALKKVNYSSKKKHFITKKLMPKNEKNI